MAADILKRALEGDMVFRLSASFRERSIAGLFVSSRQRLSTFYGIPADILRSPAVEVLLRRAGADEKKLAMSIKALCLDLNGRCTGVIRASLDGGGRVVLGSGVEIGKDDAPAGVVIKPASPKADSAITVTWTAPDATSKSATLLRLREPELIKFTVASTRAIDDQENGD